MRKVLFLFFVLAITHSFAQNVVVKDSITQLEEVVIQGTRVEKDAPFVQSNLDKKEITARNLGQDVPILLNYLPNVVTTSDAGAGIGYTGIRVRGSDATRVNVTINGIPLNDSESHGVYWVDLPDFASSTQSMQLQRGVGSSSNGAGAFGASLNLLTGGVAEKPTIVIQNSLGSFNTRKSNIQFDSGLVQDYFSFSGRLSNIHSDGYVDRASSDLNSFFLSGSYRNKNTLIKLLAFGGHEITYQSWYGVDKETFEQNPTFNYAGAIYDDAWQVVGFYDNQVDDYTQTHYQLHLNQKLTQNWHLAFSLHSTLGNGFYEDYKQDASYEDYALNPYTQNGETNSSTDLIRQKWLDNTYYGSTFSLKYNDFEQWKIILGSAYSVYDGDHFGKVIWARNASDSEKGHEYYRNNGLKKDFNIFGKMQYQISDKWEAFLDLQMRNVQYKTTDFLADDVDKNWLFFNPKAGITYQINSENQVFLSYARAHREPIRDDFEQMLDQAPKPEKLDDIELGWRYASDSFSLQSNLYAMYYNDQLVLTGSLNDVGDFIRANSGTSYRLGLELEADITLYKNIHWLPNIALSRNQNNDFYDDIKEEFADTKISYSPEFIASSQLVYVANKNWQASMFQKYIGKQYMSNTEMESSLLDAYFTTDAHFQWGKDGLFGLKNVQVTAMVNNIFNASYASNGYMWGTTPYYFPQAGTHFLVGLDLSF